MHTPYHIDLAFPDPLLLQALSRKVCKDMGLQWQHFKLLKNFTYNSFLFGKVVVHDEFITDFASIPNLTKWYIDDDSWEILFPSIIHDFIYSTPGHCGFTRLEADDLLAEAMLACDASSDKIFVVYHAVRMFGGSHWEK